MVKSGNFGQRVNSDIRLQKVNIQMRGLIKSRLIRIFAVCLVNLIFIQIIQKLKKQGRCPKLADYPNLPDFTIVLRNTSSIGTNMEYTASHVNKF